METTTAMDMGDSTMDMSDDDHSMHMHSMAMSFNNDLPVTVLFKGWVIDNSSKMIASCFGIFFIGIIYELMKYWRQMFATTYYPSDAEFVDDSDCCDPGGSTPVAKAQKKKKERGFDTCKFLLYHAINSCWHLIVVTLSYFLMLIAMTYNYLLFIAVVTGLAVGFFLTGFHVVCAKRAVSNATPTQAGETTKLRTPISKHGYDRFILDN